MEESGKIAILLGMKFIPDGNMANPPPVPKVLSGVPSTLNLATLSTVSHPDTNIFPSGCSATEVQAPPFVLDITIPPFPNDGSSPCCCAVLLAAMKMQSIVRKLFPVIRIISRRKIKVTIQFFIRQVF